MKPDAAERERIVEALEHLERERSALNVRDSAAFEAYRVKLDELRRRIREYYKMQRDRDRKTD